MCRWIVLVAVAACHAQVGDLPDADRPIDANGGPADGPRLSDGPTMNPDAMMAAPRIVYLNFTGATLTKAAASDATTNTAAWLYMANTGTAPAYRVGVGTRVADMATIINGVTARLAGIATVVTTRPTSGSYVMVIHGGAAAAVHSFFGVAVNQLDCGDAVKNDVAWITDSITPTNAVDTTMGAIGFGLGLSSTALTDDCMCSWGNTCTPVAPCVLRNNVTRATNVINDPNLGTPLTCPGATQNEITTFTTAFH